ncbi:unnamed protein product [Heterobilharzia americana]|nr:unnamed protein product [Heterobilharzia americana]
MQTKIYPKIEELNNIRCISYRQLHSLHNTKTAYSTLSLFLRNRTCAKMAVKLCYTSEIFNHHNGVHSLQEFNPRLTSTSQHKVVDYEAVNPFINNQTSYTHISK